VYRHDDKRKWSGTIRDSGKGGLKKKKKVTALHCETDVDQKVATATGDDSRCCRRKEDRDLRAVHNLFEQTGFLAD